MIATKDFDFHDGHQSEKLLQLIESKLERNEELRWTSHLDCCVHCQVALSRLTGSVELWTETREVLSDACELSRTGELQSARSQGFELGENMRWLLTMLDPPCDAGSIGTLSGRAVQGVIGQGGMGVVVRVWDAELHRPLAVKLLSPILASNGTARQRFFREAQAAAAVVHPNIVPIFAITSDAPLPCIVMPLVGGGSLQQRIDRDGPLKIEELLSIALQIAEALVAAHAQGLVHRDIKPANILIDEGGHRVLLTDFGLARTLDDASITASGMVAGTPNYMSPEQARGEQLDGRSDLYSLGAVMYAMATGHPPIKGNSALEILHRLRNDQPAKIQSRNESMPPWLDGLVSRFLDKQASTRIRSAEEAVDLLRQCLSHVRAPGRNLLPSQFQTKRPWQIAGLLTLGTLVGLILGFLATNWMRISNAGEETRFSANNSNSNFVNPSLAKLSAAENASQAAELRQAGPLEGAYEAANHSGQESGSNNDSDTIWQTLRRIDSELKQLQTDLSQSD